MFENNVFEEDTKIREKPDSLLCEACIYGKQNRKVFHASTSPNSTYPGELIYSDVCGPMSKRSPGGSLYFVSFKDDFSRFRVTYFIRHKSDVLEKFKEFVKRVRTETGNKIKRFRTDNGTEFLNKNFSDYLKSLGIVHELTAPYTPEQNGISERDNRTIVESSRCLLHGRKMPLELWAEAVNTAVYLLNRCTTKVLGNSTPYEIWYKRKPSILHLKTFGCNAYVHIPKDNRKKLDKMSIRTFFVGYTETNKNYRMWDPIARKIIISRDVIFTEANTSENIQVNQQEQVTIYSEESVDSTNTSSKPEESCRYPLRNRIREKEQSSTSCTRAISYACYVHDQEPLNYEDAIVGQNSKKWNLAMDDEFNSLMKNQTWTYVTLPADRKAIACKTILSLCALLDMEMIQLDVKSVPSDPYSKLTKEMCPKDNQEIEEMNKIPYRQTIGSLMYLMTGTRPDIAYAVSRVSQFMNNPGPSHWTAVKKIFGYLKATKNIGICFGGSSCTTSLIGFSDADFAGDLDTRKSTTGYVFMLNNGPISWCSQKQNCVSLSTTESEYIAASKATKEAIWLRQLLRELHQEQRSFSKTMQLTFFMSAPMIKLQTYLRKLYLQKALIDSHCGHTQALIDLIVGFMNLYCQHRPPYSRSFDKGDLLMLALPKNGGYSNFYGPFRVEARVPDVKFRIQPPETFDFSTPNEWPKWRKRFERYLVVSGMKKKEEADKIDLFMYLMGDRADDIFRTFKFEKEEEATRIDSVLKAFDSHFCVRKNIIYERAKFNSRIQEDREPVDEFITSLYKLADSCEFEGLHEQLIRDRIVVGVRDKALSERMQLDIELTLEKAVKMVRQQEAVRQQQVDLQRPSTSQKVNQVKFNSKKQSPKQQQQPSRKKEKSAITRSRCPKCGGFTHREGQACRAEGQRCNLCSKTGHFANCCPDKQAKTAEVKAVSELEEEIGFLLEVSAVEDSSNLDDDEGECRRRWTAEIQVNGKKVKFKLDSQADVTCVPLCLFKKIMGQQRLVESDINLRAAEFSELQTVGMFLATLRNGNYEIKEKIYVIRRLSEPLLSRRACELLNLARRIEVVATRINPIKEFPEVFEGLGQIGNPYEIKLKPGAKPYAVHTPRRVQIPLMEKLKTRLEELEKAGIIAQVNVATEWCAPTVIAGKPNGDIRLCVDLSRLNEHVQREVHPMPVVEHMLGQLGEARLFSKLDANSGFHQIPLSPDCQHLTTFITPFGRYKYCRMPFGISLAPEYFQRVMSLILQGMDGVMCYLDDILIFASDSKTHDRILRLVLRKLKEAKVTLNKAKCVFGVPRINFLGHILDEDGIRPDPAKIEAVARMPAPTDVHGVRRFLGMVNHLGRFVENLSEIVAPLNQLLVKGQDFVWDCSQERAFRKLKELLTTQPILAAYDVRKPTMVSSDASSYGLGAVLKQEGKNGIWRPVAYSSRTMTPTEKRYAQIEKEALAITWACERFQDFLLGKRFRIETDHKPLIPLFSTKELSSLTPRLQRFRMRMMRFGFEIVHIPGKELLDADALSRQPLLTTEGGENERQTSAHINAVLSSITDKDEMLTKIFEAQQEDTTLKAVVNYLEHGWPDKKKMSQTLLSYWHVKDELGVQNGLLMRGCRLVIPASMKLEILDKLHAGHFGITKTRLRARETVWWPGISEEIAETVRKCSVCIQEAVSKHEPLIPTNFPSRPWQKIGMDLFKFENKWYLVVIDYYSRFPEMIQLDRLTASVVVRSCKSIFARHGIPETVVSDNGTQFGAAREFANFARQYGFTHVTSSPRFPQSNGMAEAGVKIAKLILKKNQDPSLGLLEYRSTPLENGYSPAELLMGRKLRTTLPIAPENLNPKLVDSQTLKRKEGRRRKDMKSRYDRRCGATDMEELSEGDTVWITDMRTWGIVKKKASTPRSYMVDTPVGTLRRNRFHLRKGYAVQYPADPSTPTFSGEELVENEKTPVVDYPSNDSEDGQIRTRSGRIVKPVDRLHY
ncbi:K02A2.6-like [Cordylochernes scorpioides]|uniref:RNA-directed DNA polymerase n=1 Tax=Cordylochernes scorpioides TaxID=51811 RepID=A0ABY6JY27_9ARAC|nr:K02A2.6-like [Cordylochernes scorpioides]